MRNRVYLGEAVHKGQIYRGEHDAIVPKTLWDLVRARLGDQKNQSRRSRRQPSGAMLTGLLFDDRGNLMSPSHATKRNGKRYRYYVSQAVLQYRNAEAGSLPRMSAHAIECFVEDRVRALLAKPTDKSKTPDMAAIRRLLRRVELARDLVVIQLDQPRGAKLRCAAGGDVERRGERVVMRIPARLRSWGGEKIIEAPSQTLPARVHVDHALIKALGRANCWRNALLRGSAASLNDIAAASACTNRYVKRILALAFLAPDIVNAILAGTQPRSMTVATVLNRQIPLSSTQQRRVLGLAPANS